MVIRFVTSDLYCVSALVYNSMRVINLEAEHTCSEKFFVRGGNCE